MAATAQIDIRVNAGQAIQQIGLVDRALRSLSQNAVGRAALQMNRFADAINKAAFKLSFMGFLMQFISLMTVMMLSRIQKAIFGVIESIADWRQNITDLMVAALATADVMGLNSDATQHWGKRIKKAFEVGMEAEKFLGFLKGVIADIKTAFGEGLFEGNIVEDFIKELTEKPKVQVGPWVVATGPSILEQLEETFRMIGKAAQPFITSLLDIAKFFADPANKEGIETTTKIIIEFMTGILKGIPTLTMFIDKLKPIKDTVDGMVPGLKWITDIFFPGFITDGDTAATVAGKLLIPLIFMGTIFSLTGPLLTGLGLVIKGFAGLAVVLGFGLNGVGWIVDKVFGPGSMDIWKYDHILKYTDKVKEAFKGLQTSFGGLTRGQKAGAIGGALLMGAGATLLGTGGLNAFVDENAKMEDKIKGAVGSTALAFGTAIEIATFNNPVLGKIALIGAAFASAVASVLIFRKEIRDMFAELDKILANNKFIQTFDKWWSGVLKGAEEWADKLVGNSIIPDTMDLIVDTVRSRLDVAKDLFADFAEITTQVTESAARRIESLSETGPVSDTLATSVANREALRAQINQEHQMNLARGAIGGFQAIGGGYADNIPAGSSGAAATSLLNARIDDLVKARFGERVGFSASPVYTTGVPLSAIAANTIRTPQDEATRMELQEFMRGPEIAALFAQFNAGVRGGYQGALNTATQGNPYVNAMGQPITPQGVAIAGLREGRTPEEQLFLEMTGGRGGRVSAEMKDLLDRAGGNSFFNTDSPLQRPMRFGVTNNPTLADKINITLNLPGVTNLTPELAREFGRLLAEDLRRRERGSLAVI